MKHRFVKITLVLTMLFVMAVPAQAFAATKNCNLNQNNAINAQISKIYSQLPQTSINKLMGTLAQYSGGKIDTAQIQKLIRQITNGKVTTTPATPSKPATPTTPATPSKPATPTTPATPSTPTTPSKPATPTTPATPSEPASQSLGAYEQQVVDLVNKERAAAGLPALKVNLKLSAVAEKKAEDLRDNKYFDHNSPVYGSPFDMMKQFGISYKAAGENIAKGQKTPEAVMNGWMNSAGHRANILSSNYTEIGVGYVTDSNGTTYWVQHFIRP